MGVEIAGDVKEDYMEKEVVLIHPREALVNDKVNESFQTTIKNRLKQLGVQTILGTCTPCFGSRVDFTFVSSLEWKQSCCVCSSSVFLFAHLARRQSHIDILTTITYRSS